MQIVVGFSGVDRSIGRGWCGKELTACAVVVEEQLPNWEGNALSKSSVNQYAFLSVFSYVCYFFLKLRMKIRQGVGEINKHSARLKMNCVNVKNLTWKGFELIYLHFWLCDLTLGMFSTFLVSLIWFYCIWFTISPWRSAVSLMEWNLPLWEHSQIASDVCEAKLWSQCLSLSTVHVSLFSSQPPTQLLPEGRMIIKRELWKTLSKCTPTNLPETAKIQCENASIHFKTFSLQLVVNTFNINRYLRF